MTYNVSIVSHVKCAIFSCSFHCKQTDFTNKIIFYFFLVDYML